MDSYKKTGVMYKDKGDKKILLSIPEFLQSCTALFAEDTTCIPYPANNPAKVPRGVFNTYGGMKAQIVDEVDMARITLILWHLQFVICGGEEASYEWMLNWFAFMMQKPHMQTRVAVLIYSLESQIGKSEFFTLIREHVYGQELSIYMSGLDELVETHNYHLYGKGFAQIEELQALDKKFRDGKLKTMITDRNLSIRPLFRGRFQALNVLNFVFLSNEINCLPVTNSTATRFAIFNASDCKKGDLKYFQRLNDAFGEEGEDGYTGADHFYTFLLQQKLDLELLRNPPETQIKKDMCQSSKEANRYTTFIEEVLLTCDLKEDHELTDMELFLAKHCFDIHIPAYDREGYYGILTNELTKHYITLHPGENLTSKQVSKDLNTHLCTNGKKYGIQRIETNKENGKMPKWPTGNSDEPTAQGTALYFPKTAGVIAAKQQRMNRSGKKKSLGGKGKERAAKDI